MKERDELLKLLELQEKDMILDALNNSLKEIPMKINSLKKKIEENKKLVREKEEELKDKDKRLKTLFYEIEDIEGSISKFEQDKLKVRTNEEYKALEREIFLAKEKKERVENETLAFMEELEELKVNVENLREKLEMENEKIESEIQDIEKELKRIQEEFPIKRDERLRAEKRVSVEYLERYEKIRSSGKKSVVVPVENGVCGGCSSFVPTTVQDKLRREKDIDVCENCGRLLYIEIDEP